MADLSKLTDAELKALYAASTDQPRGVEAMSDDELRATYAAGQPQGSAVERAARYADDLVRQAANGATFGLADRAAAWLSGTSQADEAARTKAAQERTGMAGTAANIAGSLVPAGVIAKGVGAAARYAPSMYGVGTVAANPFTQAATSGAIYGGTDAAIQGQNIGQGAALGAGAGLIGQGAASALTGAASRVAGAFNRRPQIPTQPELREAANRAYAASEQAGVVVRPDAVTRLRQNVEKSLAEFGYAPEIQPGVAGVLNGLARAEGQNVTLKGLDTLRKTAGHLRGSSDASTRAVGNRLVNEIDDFLRNLGPADVLTGNSSAGVGALQEARRLWQRSAKADTLADALGKAELRAASTGSGGNIDNATRQNVRRVLEKGRGWTPDEQAALREIVTGTPSQNALRQAGKLAPGGNGLMTALNLGAVVANPWMALASAGGAASKYAADRMTGAAVKRAEDLILSGGNSAALQVPPNAFQRFVGAQRDPLGRALAVGGYEEVAPELTIRRKQKGLLD